MRHPLLIFSLITIFYSCSFRSEKTPQEYMKWMNDESNGLVKKKYINGLVFTVKYLSPDLLAYQELKNQPLMDEAGRKKVLDNYQHNMTFLVSVAPDESKETMNAEKDVMYLGVKNPKEYQERAMTMNFDMKEFMHLQLNDSSIYKAVLANMENTYGIDKGRNILCVFEPYRSSEEFQQSETIDFIWDDEIFKSGRNHFVFDSKDFLSLPQLKF